MSVREDLFRGVERSPIDVTRGAVVGRIHSEGIVEGSITRRTRFLAP